MEDAGSPVEGQSGLSSGQQPADLQIAQATAAGVPGDAIGTVNQATGDVFIVHKDGTSEQAAAGTPVYADDIVATGTDGEVEVVFKDGTTFSLGSNGQMRLDNLIYDPAGSNNGLDATIVKGSFVFITGNVGSAQGEGVSIDTPAGTIGIRGTSGGVAKDPQTGTWIFTLFRDPDGTLSRFTVTNPAGEQLLDQEFETTQVAGRLIAPARTIVLSPAQASVLFADALHLLKQQFPQLQRSELDVDPAAGEEQYAIKPGQLPPSPESLSAMFGMSALGAALLDLLGNDTGQNEGGAPSAIDGGTPTFEPVSESGPGQLTAVDDNLPFSEVPIREGSPQAIPISDVLSNDKNLGSGVTIEVVDQPDNGTVALDSTGTNFIYTPNPDFGGTDSFTYRITDAAGHASEATVTVVVDAIANQPTILALGATEADILNTTAAALSAPAPAEDHPITLNVSVQFGDFKDGSESHAITISAPPPGWTVVSLNGWTQNADGSFSLDVDAAALQQADGTFGGPGPTLQPPPDFNGSVDFQVQAIATEHVSGDPDTSNNVAVAEGTLTVDIAPANDPPVAVNDEPVTTAEDTPVTIAVLANDTDVDGDPLTIGQASALHGTVVINDDGTLTYTPDPNYNGPDTISYTANDGTAESNVATVAVTVTAANDTPVAADDTAATAEDTPVTIAVLANDSDVDGDGLTVTEAAALHGTVVINADGTLTYTPAANYNGPDTITYSIADGHGGTASATVAVTVTAENDPPVAADDTATTAEDTPVTIPVLANDSDIDGDALTVTEATAQHGTVVINADGTLTYTPAANYNGPDTIAYSIADGHGGTASATVAVTVTPVNDDPVATDDSATTAEDTPVTIAVLANDSDVDGDSLTVTAASAEHGTVVINDNGTLTYTPAANYNGPDTISYSIADGHGGTASASVAVTVTPANDDPVAINDTATTAEDTPVTIPVLANDSDLDGDDLAVTEAAALHGTVVINSDGTLTYTPAANYNGPDTVTYSIADGHGGTASATVAVTVTPVNDDPVAKDDSATTAEDTPVTIAVLANDSDVDGDDMSVTEASAQHGTVAINKDGTLTYTPSQNYNGPDTITYSISDGHGGTASATVAVTVTPVNDAPTAANDSVKTAEDTPLTIAAATLLANDKDADGDALKIASVDKAQHGTVTLNADGSVTYTPDANYSGPDSFTYQAGDGAALSNVATVTIDVAPVNDPPLAVDDGPYQTAENKPVSIALADLLKNDSDPENDNLTVTDVKAVKGGTVTIEGDHVVFTPDRNFDGAAQFSYTVSDGNGGTDTAIVTVNVADDKPVASADSAATADRSTQSVNLVIILDLSGSMGEDPGVAGFSTRLELARAAIAALFEAQGSVADLHIQIVGFSSTAAASPWFDSIEDANAYIAALAAGGGTNYAAAIQAAMASFGSAPDADRTEIYFLSDGAPSAGNSLHEAGLVDDWEAFLADPANGIDKAFAVGIGQGLQADDPDLADVAYPNDDPSTLLVVTNESQLIPTLVGTVANPVSGNVLDNDSFGADGKGNGGNGLLSITVDGVTYTYSGGKFTTDKPPPQPPQIDGAKIVIVTGIGGSLEFHFDTGAYTYVPPDAIGNEQEDFTYTIVDGDGSMAQGTLTIDITDSGTVESDPSTIIGTDNADNLAGTLADDIMSGGKGSDSIAGGDGNDHIQGGNDNDSLAGGGGIDILVGGAGNDTVDGGAGNDIVIGGTGADSLVGGAGDDRIAVGAGGTADGGAGNDLILVTSTGNIGAVHGGGTDAVDLAAQHGDVLAFNGALDLTKLANTRIDGIETISMADSAGGNGADTLTLNSSDVIDLGTGQFNPAGAFGGFGELPDAPAIRVDGDSGDSLALSGGGWQQVTTGPGGVPAGYVLYVHDSPADGTAADAYVLVQTTVKVTTG